MCGILGILDNEKQINTKHYSIPNSSEILKHRGPDDFGYYLNSNIYLAQRRLSIIDLNTGKQPIFNEDKSCCIVFNGEIYNYKDIRNELEKNGHIFSTNTDTETIIHAYEQWGEACVNRLRGMFAFALWDENEKKLFIARDRLGIKPLFYAFIKNKFYFASEMKAILQYREIPRDIDNEAVSAYFTLAYIPVPLTIYKNIRKLPPGHTLVIKSGSLTIKKFWDIYFQPDRSKSENYFIDNFMGLLEEAVGLRMISDVPLGAFLSGGIDSGTVVAIMARLSTLPVRTFSLGFGGEMGGYLDEREYARQVAYRYKTIHTEDEIFPEIINITTQIVRSFDEPFADPTTIPSYYLYKMARENITVALSGLGGDEVFGGYERYLGFRLSFFYNRLPFFFRDKIIRNIVENLPERTDGHYTINHLKRFVRSASLNDPMRYYGFISMLGKDRDKSLFADFEAYKVGFEICRDHFSRYFNSNNCDDPLDKVFYTDIKTYLPEDILACTDRLSMWHSLEVRVPFLDHKLMEFCATIPYEMKIKIGEKKHLLKKAVRSILPKSVFNHRKQGFIGPMTMWLRKDLKSYAMEVLSKKNLNKHQIFNCETVISILNEHFSRKEINDKLIWSLIIFQVWHDIYIENPES